MLGLMPTEKGEALRLRGVVNYFGPTEFRQMDRIEGAGKLMLIALMGGRLEGREKMLAHASPMAYVDRTDPPILTLHGTKDNLVPIEGSQLLHETMVKAQIPGQLFPMEGTGHGIGGDRKKGQALLRNVLEYYLRGSDMELLSHEDFDKGVGKWEPVEDRCSGWAVDNAIRDAAKNNPDCPLAQLLGKETGGEAKHLAESLAQDDPVAQDILDTLTHDLAFALSHVTHLFHPQVIILGGGLSLVGAPLRKGIEKKLPQFLMETYGIGPQIKLAELTEDAVPVGALLL